MQITLLQLALAALAAFGTYKIIVKLLNGRMIN
jgi:hypothetical protein